MQAGTMAKDIRRVGIPATIKGEPNPDYAPAVVRMLTAREKEVCDLAIQGMTHKEMGRRLSISPRTVESHVGAIFTKFGVKNKVGLIYKIKGLANEE